MASISLSKSAPEIWGGIECTINRVGERYSDQLVDAGCYDNDRYLAAVAGLNIQKIRFPVLWERHQPVLHGGIDWSWADRQLHKLRDHGVEPILGLLHHGSGPAYTHLADPAFPQLFAAYARQVAMKFPWARYYTPVNEPLTTARFSGLYGLWYPHKKEDNSFLTMLINQAKAVVLAMKAIREINPEAVLVQTEDLSKTHSTPLLQYQRDFENERRWLSFDLLCGKVNEQHPLWTYITGAGITTGMLQFFIDEPCVPGIMGLNYYMTSERYLDEDLHHYPACTHGSNGKHNYADVEAVRVCERSGLKTLLHETHARFQLPVAVTEVHLSCTREEQMRWFGETWKELCEAKKEGIPVLAMTAWSVLGAYDWNSLLTRKDGVYESGAFDHCAKKLRPTALAKMIQTIAAGNEPAHPVLEDDGWWKRDCRYLYHPNRHRLSPDKPRGKPVLVIGRNGTLGHAFEKICARRGLACKAVGREEIDILDERSVKTVLAECRPWAVINAAGYVRVDDAEEDRARCFMVNTLAPALLARVCKQYGLPFVTYSSDLVFDGQRREPYYEADQACPLNVYGQSKAEAERLVLAEDPDALVIRTSAFFGPWDVHNFAHHVLRSVQTDRYCDVAGGMVVSPTYVPDLVDTSLDILIDGEKGLWHLCNEGYTDWVDFAEELAGRIGYKREVIRRRAIEEMRYKAPRPLYSVLSTDKGIRLPKLEKAIDRFFEEKTA